MTVTLIISTYNRVDALTLCLESVLRQTTLPNEIIIGDDGSKQETTDTIKHYQSISLIPIRHIWQEDKGFRLAMARNKCIAAAKGEYIIQIDGDLILHKRFVEDHLKFAEKGWYIKGGRVNINLKKTEKLCKELKPASLNFFSSGLLRRINSIHCIPIAKYLAPRRKTAPGLGCNMGYFREDAVKINGYDEFYEGWGGEDYDFVVRLMKLGIRKKSLKFAGIVFHLWHNDLYMDNRDKNFNYLHEIEKLDTYKCKSGIDQYL